MNYMNELTIEGLGTWLMDDLSEILLSHIESNLSFVEDLKVKRLFIVGSRVTKSHHENSDLDVVFEYEGSIKEFSLSDILNDQLEIDGVLIDFMGTKGFFEDVVNGRQYMSLSN